jgi:hypothetical protein
MAKIKNRVGESFVLKSGELVKITDYINESNCSITLEDGNVIKNKSYGKIKKGFVKNVFSKTVYNIGFVGSGEYNSKSKNHKIAIKTWRSMIGRCYDEKELKKHPTYLGCSVCDSWHNFQNFAEWFNENYKSDIMKGWHLDKDILIKGNKIYSPNSCCFVPFEINQTIKKDKEIKKNNNLPIGVTKYKNKYRVFVNSNKKLNYFGTFDNVFDAFLVYKKEKESRIKSIAEKWKNKIDNRVYEVLINFEI